MNKMILLVDDKADLIEYLAEILESMSIDVNILTAYTGAEAKKLIEKSHKTITIIFLDIVLPDTTGLKIYDYIRGFSKEIKIVFMSGHPLAEFAIDGEDNLFFLHKPFNFEDVELIMEQISE